MKNKKLFAFFSLVIALQVAIASTLGAIANNTALNGVSRFFKCAPSTYCNKSTQTLSFSTSLEKEVSEPEARRIEKNNSMLVTLEYDSKNFAKIKDFKEPFDESEGNFLNARVYIKNNCDKNKHTAYFSLPFSSYALTNAKCELATKRMSKLNHDLWTAQDKNDKAKIAEAKSRLDKTYAIIAYKNGLWVCKDVLIDGVSVNNLK